MKKLVLSLLLLIPSISFADTATTGNPKLILISTGSVDRTRSWGDKINENFSIISTSMSIIFSSLTSITPSVSFADLTDVNDSGRAVNLVPKFNGTEIVWAAYDASFSFAIASFSNGLSSTIEIGAAGTWKSVGSISFTATYTNGPATGGYVSKTGWGSNLTMTNSFQGPTTNTETVPYPSVAGTVVFTLNATNGTDSPTSSITHTFYNRRYWGVSSVASGYTSANVTGLASNELSNSKSKTFTVTAGATEYIIFAYPSRLGTATFTVGGFTGGFNSPETVSVTNASGYVENYYVYRSANLNLGNTTVTAS